MELNLTMIISLIVAIAWVIAWIIYQNRDERLVLYPFFLMVRIPLSLRPKRRSGFSKLAWMGVLLLFWSMIMFYYNVFGIIYYRYLKPVPGASKIGFAPLIPGVTVPWSILPHVLLALGIAALFHELSHAIVARVEGLKVKSTGIALFAFIPAAFVEIDENELRKSRVSTRLKVYSAGVGANVILFLFFMSIILGGCAHLSSGVKVIDVVHSSIAELAGIHKGDVIVEVNGVKIRCVKDLASLLEKIGVTDPNREAYVSIKVLRDGSVVSFNIHKPRGTSRIGITIINSFNNIGYIVYFSEMLNYALALINAAPIFITDGARIVEDLLKFKVKEGLGKAISLGIQLATLMLVLSVLTIAPILPS